MLCLIDKSLVQLDFLHQATNIEKITQQILNII